MLNKEEENRLEGIIQIISTAKENNRMPLITAYDMEWLASKLKETNDKFKKYDNSIKELMDKEWASHWERNKEEEEDEDNSSS